jgi:hypothetical protein
MAQIQSQYNIFQQIGLVGQCARAGEPMAFDTAEVGVDGLVPGDAVYLNSSGEWIKPTSTATRLLATHILGYDSGVVSTAITTPTTNSLGQIVYNDGDVAKAFALGAVYVIAGASVSVGDLLEFDQGDDRWIPYEPATPSAADLPRITVRALTAGSDGDIIEVRHYGITNPITITTAVP